MKKYACKKCGDRFAKKQQLGLHHRWQHPKKKEPTKRKYTKRKQAHAEHTHPATNGSNGKLSLADVNARYRQASEVAAAVAFLQQFGTVDFKESK